ncbi:M48 family metallopeptidase [Rhodoferax sp.]|uniref:M48 family metallopeptidase n=1 Tax=Rhodoferax sp. TaxID=50421 RepID=UPI0027457BE2|nr:M48 family metallopeptidase [Rhodoferax sp.]
MDKPPQPALAATYFDGVSARPQAVMLHIDATHLRISGAGIDRAVSLSELQWPERTRHGVRVAHLQAGGSVQSADNQAWDAWRTRHGLRDAWVVRMQQSWPWVMASLATLVLLVVVLQRWGLPALAGAVVAATPHSVDRALGEATLQAIDSQLMQPSQLPASEQARLGAAFARAVASLPASQVPPWQLVFRKSRIGPNAFALPGGTMVMTDELVQRVGADEQVITGVLAHELSHVQHRHGLRMLVQVTVLGSLAGAVLGDFSSVLASVPVLLGHASYSREAEREADAGALRLLKAAAISPLVMVTLFDKLEQDRRKEDPSPAATKANEHWLGIAFASHPPDAARVQFFRTAATQP